MPSRNHFDLIAVVDFSAASSPGTSRAQEDRCWAAFTWKKWRSEPCYFQTRHQLLDGLSDLLNHCKGPALVAWDFPFGYPVGSGLGGGRHAAGSFVELVQDCENDANNRFAVAAGLNQRVGTAPGPFWGCPAGQEGPLLSATKPKPWNQSFQEWRIAENLAKRAGFGSIQSVWKLYTTGSVGSQAIMGLATIERLNKMTRHGSAARYWPFDTGWDRDLAGLVHAECWPTLFPPRGQPFAMNDARQVMAVRDELEAANRAGNIGNMLAAPQGLAATDLKAVETEEGWIVGLNAVMQAA